jgi:nickel-dependent lactate racemase
VTSIELPWAAWYADSRHQLALRESWQVDCLPPRGGAALTAEEIRDAIDQPIDSHPLTDLARGRKSACIVIDDVARPTRTADLLPTVLERLTQAGLDDRAVRIVVAVGSHRGLTEQELTWKVGDGVQGRCHVECHDCRGDLVGTGITYGDRELRINRTFMEADLKLVIGSVLPHPFAGYSGGAKLVLPGLADLMSIQRSHQFVQMGLRGGTDPNENRFRLEAERIGRELGLQFAICVVPGAGRETIGLHAGDFVIAHRRACVHAADALATELHGTYDCAIVNAFPKDIDLIQAESAFTAWKAVRSPVVKEGGVVVLTCAAPMGRGRHGLFEPGGVSYRPPHPQRWLKGRELWLYTPNVPAAEVRELYWGGYPVYHDGATLMAALADRLPKDAKLAVFPCGPMQVVRDLR